MAMKMRIDSVIKQLITLLFSSVLLVACASSETSSKAGEDLDYRGSDCISIRTVRDYTPLDNRNLLVKGMGKRQYLVSLVVPAFELRSSGRLRFSSRDDWLCPYGGDQIVFDGFSSQGIGIRSISRVTEEQADELLIRYGKKSPDEQEDLDPSGSEPPDVKGAEVEELG